MKSSCSSRGAAPKLLQAWEGRKKLGQVLGTTLELRAAAGFLGRQVVEVSIHPRPSSGFLCGTRAAHQSSRRHFSQPMEQGVVRRADGSP